MSHRIITLALLVAAAVACSDRSPVGPPPSASTGAPDARERLTQMFARALRNPGFRAYLKAQLDASPFAEHKIQLQTFLGANGGRAQRYLVQENGAEPPPPVAIALEVYLPVPAHRAAWTGDDNVLVATALTDGERPVAFGPRNGSRQVLDDAAPPATPVIAIVPVETDFSVTPSRTVCMEECDTGGGTDPLPPPPQPTAPAAGLYMTKSHFTQDFEGWLKGAPEFEVHILGQKGQTDSLMSYQCAGEHAGAPYFFNQDAVDWSGSVLVFSKVQIDQYNATHPAQNMRVFVVEDDDASCEIVTGKDSFSLLTKAVDGANQGLTAGNDTSSSTLSTIWKYAKGAYQFIINVASLIKTNDELVGNAVQDVIAGEYHPGFNWIVKGDQNVTNGWINLEMR